MQLTFTRGTVKGYLIFFLPSAEAACDFFSYLTSQTVERKLWNQKASSFLNIYCFTFRNFNESKILTLTFLIASYFFKRSRTWPVAPSALVALVLPRSVTLLR